MNFKFHKGKHRARPFHWLCWWPLLINPTSISRRVRFTDASRYLLDNGDQEDRIKLYGISFSWSPHRNSARFTCWYDSLNDLWTITAYCYLNGERIMEDLCSIPPNVDFDLHLLISTEDYIFRVQQVYDATVKRTTHISKGHRRRNCYLLGPFFGGNRPAPRTLKLDLTRIKY